LNNTGPGSLRLALMQPAGRIIVFTVSGVIDITSSLTIQNSFVTVAGETAPGAGITIRQNGLNGGIIPGWGVADVVMRFIRVRGASAGNFGDALKTSSRMIMDHCSFGWACDETIDLTGDGTDNTVQWCILNEPEFNCEVPAGGGKDATILSWGLAANFSLHHNLFTHHYDALEYSGEHIDVRNNVIYNYRDFGIGWQAGEIGTNVPFPHVMNIVGNYFKRGPNSGTAGPINIWGTAGQFQYYIADNYHYVSTSQQVTSQASIADAGWTALAANYSGTPAVATHPVLTAQTRVLDSAGAWPRDSLDKRSVKETRDGTGSQTTRAVSLTAGLTATIPPPDTDRDGMPDCWELNQGLNPTDSTDAVQNAPDGYNWIEKYCHFRAAAVLGREADEWCGSSTAAQSRSRLVSGWSVRPAQNPFGGRIALTVAKTGPGRERWS
jgi:hypothetical protein